MFAVVTCERGTRLILRCDRCRREDQGATPAEYFAALGWRALPHAGDLCPDCAAGMAGEGPTFAFTPRSHSTSTERKGPADGR